MRNLLNIYKCFIAELSSSIGTALNASRLAAICLNCFIFWFPQIFCKKSPKMLFVGAMHILFGSPQLNKAAAFPAGALSERATPPADVQSAAVLAFTAPLFLGQCGYHLGNFFVYPLGVKLLKKAFLAERTAHFSVTQTTEQGGSSALTAPFSSLTLYSVGATRSGASKSLKS